MISSKCPRCSEEEDWEHVILCESITSIRNDYIQTLKTALRKVKDCNHLHNQIEWMLEDIEQYLNSGEPYEGVTIQKAIGMNTLFRGWITKNWENISNNQPKKMHTLNKIIVKHSIKFYSKAWNHRNEVKHNPHKYKEFVRN